MSGFPVKQWKFEVPLIAGTFIRSMKATKIGRGLCEGTLEIEVRDTSGGNPYDYHISFSFTDADRRLRISGGTILGGDRAETFRVGQPTTGDIRRYTSQDHQLIGKFNEMMNDIRLIQELESFSASDSE